MLLLLPSIPQLKHLAFFYGFHLILHPSCDFLNPTGMSTIEQLLLTNTTRPYPNHQY